MRHLFLLFLLLLPHMAVAEHRFTAADLSKALAEAIQTSENLEDVRVQLLGDYPATLYQHSEPMIPQIQIASLEPTQQRVTADVVLKPASAPDAAALGKAFTVQARYEEWVKLPVAVRRINSKEPIAEADLSWQSFPKRRIERETLTDVKDIIGMAPRRSLPANRPITTADIMQPILVKKNDPVTMSYETPHMKITALGYANQDGAMGDRIGVRNADSNTTVYAIISGPGLVQVSNKRIQP